MMSSSSSNQGIDNDSIPSLYKWAGGAPAFEKLTSIFYRYVLG
jgi:truncated hemoglobin YjbI